jgi:hypothetical protein
MRCVTGSQGFVKMMRKRVNEIAAAGPLGSAPTALASLPAGTGAHHRANDVPDNEKATQPMFCWDPAWPQYVGMAQQIVRASLIGELPDTDRVGFFRLMLIQTNQGGILTGFWMS